MLPFEDGNLQNIGTNFDEAVAGMILYLQKLYTGDGGSALLEACGFVQQYDPARRKVQLAMGYMNSRQLLSSLERVVRKGATSFLSGYVQECVQALATIHHVHRGMGHVRWYPLEYFSHYVCVRLEDVVGAQERSEVEAQRGNIEPKRRDIILTQTQQGNYLVGALEGYPGWWILSQVTGLRTPYTPWGLFLRHGFFSNPCKENVVLDTVTLLRRDFSYISG
ncbi:hypothetical protein COY95_01750 [Candidatus Woesearchaeota archaeon CG_4_10_14_0_8_um_filter_47_5]|nr:MAG: hypothetical protein COY95_01750 [Candidatus Woesearchaeota archaeon CG_4_10_14_0_8_um_filter_47_5]